MSKSNEREGAGVEVRYSVERHHMGLAIRAKRGLLPRDIVLPAPRIKFSLLPETTEIERIGDGR